MQVCFDKITTCYPVRTAYIKYPLFFDRFVILKRVPRELLHQLPVPERIREYLDTPFYYSEDMADGNSKAQQVMINEAITFGESISEANES